MKVLLSAYACEPGRGSEPGVGWHWALEIARLGHEVHVLTRSNNRAAIESARKDTLPAGLTFHYYDLKPWQRFWKRGGRGLLLYYWLWQLGAARLAKRVHRHEHFNVVHHLTLGSIKLPTYMGRLGIPFVLGPIGGGETAPPKLRRGYSLRGQLLDAIRDVATSLSRYFPAVGASHLQASRLLLRTADNLRLIAHRDRHKVTIATDIGSPEVPAAARRTGADGPLSLLYVGRFVHWKGLHLAIEALSLAAGTNPHVHLTLIGDGPERPHLERLAHRLGVGGHITWVGWLPHDQVADAYRAHDVFVFPSLHDSGGSVMLEAAAYGLPIVCLNTGGPGMLFDPACGFRVDVEDRTQPEVVAEIAQRMLQLAAPDLREQFSRSALLWATRRSWSSAVAAVYGEIDRPGV